MSSHRQDSLGHPGPTESPPHGTFTQGNKEPVEFHHLGHGPLPPGDILAPGMTQDGTSPLAPVRHHTRSHGSLVGSAGELRAQPGRRGRQDGVLRLRVLPNVVGGLLEGRQAQAAGDGVEVAWAIQRVVQQVSRSLVNSPRLKMGARRVSFPESLGMNVPF